MSLKYTHHVTFKNQNAITSNCVFSKSSVFALDPIRCRIHKLRVLVVTLCIIMTCNRGLTRFGYNRRKYSDIHHRRKFGLEDGGGS